MKPLDSSLQRLLDAAAQSPAQPPPPMSYALQSRILANWRSGQQKEEDIWMMTFLRRAIILGSIVMILSFGATWSVADNSGLTAITSYASIELVP